MPKRRNNRKTKRYNIKKRATNYIENEIEHINPLLNRKTLELGVRNDYDEFYQIMMHRKWHSMTNGQKQAVSYHIENNKVFSLEEKVVDFLLPKCTKFDEIDLSNKSIKSLPKAFILDLSEGRNMFTCDDGLWTVEELWENDGWEDMFNQRSMFPTGINSVLVFFTDKDNNLCEINSTCDVNIIAKYKRNPKYGHEEEDERYVHFETTLDKKVGLEHLLFDREDAFKSWQTDDDDSVYPANYSFQTLEEVRMAFIDTICDDLGIEEHARESYSNAYLRAVGKSLFGDTYEAVIGESDDQTANKLMRKTLLTPIIGGEYKDNLLICRRLLVKNIVFSFLKALSKDLVLPKRVLGSHPIHRSRKKNKNNPSHKPYTYITIDADKLLTLRRERKSQVRKSEQYQTQVKKTMGYRWVKEDTPKGLKENEDIYDIMESKTGAILYKVKRPVSGYTRNAHLPKRNVETPPPKSKVVRVRNII